ncbi:MAG TPA: DUF5666 domain-containing protein [Roseiflexaceae bacterium]|nr:DUF5666 domain-containing protein [Roseiflexaceae bacterium]
MKRRQFLSITAGALLAAAGTATAGVAWAASDPSLERGPGRGRGPHVGGEVTAVAGTTLTVATPHGSQQIVTSATTTFTLDGAAATLASITVGMHLRAEGIRADDGTFTATAIVAFSEKPAAVRRGPPAWSNGRGPGSGGRGRGPAKLPTATPESGS